MCRLSWSLGASTSWNPHDLSRPVIGLLYYITNFPGAEIWTTNTSSASQKIPRASSNPKVHTAFTSARQLPLSWATAIQSTPPRLSSCRSVLMLSLHPSLGLTSGLFTSRHTWRLLVLVYQRSETPSSQQTRWQGQRKSETTLPRASRMPYMARQELRI